MKKTIIIIGAGKLVGFAVAERFGNENYNIALISKNEDNLNELVKELLKIGIDASYFVADVMNRISLSDALNNVKLQFGQIDVVEFSPVPPMELIKRPREITVENAQYFLDFRVLSVVDVVQTVLPEMLTNRSGSLLFTTSASAQIPVLITASYGIAAGALLNYVRLLNKDLVPDNIFAGILSIGALVYKTDKPDEDLIKLFPEGMPTIAAKEVAEKLWIMHHQRNQSEIVLGDINEYLKASGNLIISNINSAVKWNLWFEN